MTTKCTGLMGRIFWHKLIRLNSITMKYMNQSNRACWAILSTPMASIFLNGRRYVCQRCGAVTGEKK